jgi:hypothetical protein
MKMQEPAHPSEPNDKQSESQSELMTRVLRDMEALDLINLGEQSEREHDAKEAA